MDLTDDDEDYVIRMLLERSNSSPAGLQSAREEESYCHTSELVNVFNPSAVSDDPPAGSGSSKLGCHHFGVQQKRGTQSDVFEMQDYDTPKRKCFVRAQSEQDGMARNKKYVTSVPNSGSEEVDSYIGDLHIGEMVNNLSDRPFTADQKFEYMINRMAIMELEMKGFNAANVKLSEDLKSLADQNIRLSERIEQLEDNGLCCVCHVNKISIWVDPCHHWVMCVACFKKLREARNDNAGNMPMKCPLCRGNINCAIPYYGINDEVI